MKLTFLFDAKYYFLPLFGIALFDDFVVVGGCVVALCSIRSIEERGALIVAYYGAHILCDTSTLEA